MDQNTLRERLAKLHAELTRAQQENPAARRLLDEILPDVKRLLDDASVADAASAASLPDRLERVAVQFEAEHPRLAASARRLIDLLGEVGI
jgi:glutathione S-transferase